MIAARRWLGSAALAAAAMLLTACTTIPTSGPVNEGTGVVSSAEPFVPIADGPRLDDGPTQIVNGFVRASTAGFASDFSVAREFLTQEAAASWDPTEKVIVFDSGALTPTFDATTATVTYDIPVKATVDSSGHLTEAADGTRQTLRFGMKMNDEGQWRISGLDNGAILAYASFQGLFTDVDLIFASVDESTQVPDQRWFPANKAATLAAKELVEGPSPLLAGAVHTGFPATSALEVESVQVTNGVASVQLTADSAGNAAERSLAQQQMDLTLRSVGGISAVTVTVGGLPLGGDGSAALGPAPLPGIEAYAFVNERLGMWDGADVWQVRNSVGGLPPNSRGIARTFTDGRAVWLLGAGTLVSSDAVYEGAKSLDPAPESDDPAGSVMKTTTLYEGTSLINPSTDRHGWIWTAERDGEHGLIAVDGSGEAIQLDADWLRGTTIQALALSRDGARVAVLSRAGGRQMLEFAAIVRGDDGAPLSIGEPQTYGIDLGPSIGLTWLDDLTVAVLGEAGGDVQNDLWLVDVGGFTTEMKAVTNAVDITARQGERSLIVVDAGGSVYIRSGTVWSKVTTGVRELAYSG